MLGSVPKPIKTGLTLTAVSLAIGAIFLAAAVLVLNSRSGGALRVGMQAPAFVAKGEDGRTHRLADYRGRPVALAFCPGSDADSIAELRSIRDNIRKVDALGMKVFGVSPLPQADLKALHDRERLPFPLLTDDQGELARAYGLRQPANPLARVTVAIGPDGRVLLPILQVDPVEHGRQLVDLTECCLDKKSRPTSALMGKPVPNVTLVRASDGKPERALGNGKRITVLIMLSAECPCSAGYDGRIRDLARAYEPRGVRFVAVYAPNCEPSSEVVEHATRAGFTFPVVRDPGNVLADKLQAQVTPEAFVIDATGVLRYHGRIDDSREASQVKARDLRNALDLLIAGQSPNPAETLAFGCAIARGS
jgi:peroxiredoxin